MRRGLLLASAPPGPSIFDETPSASLILSPTSTEQGGGLADTLSATFFFVVTESDFSVNEYNTQSLQLSITEADQIAEVENLSQTIIVAPTQSDVPIVSPEAALTFIASVTDEQSALNIVTIVLSPSLGVSVERIVTASWTSSASTSILQNLSLSVSATWTSVEIVLLLKQQAVVADSTWTSSTIIISANEFLSSPWEWTTILVITLSYPALPNPFRTGISTPTGQETALPPGVPSEVTLVT